MKKHKCKVCNRPIKQKRGPGRPKTMHDRCKGKKKTKKKIKKRTKTKKKAPKKKKAGLLQIQKCSSCKNWTQGKHHCWNCGKKMSSKVQSKRVTLAEYGEIQRSQARAFYKKSSISPLDEYYSLGRRKNPFRRNARIRGYRPGSFRSEEASESRKCEHLVTDQRTGITKPCGKITRDKKIYCPEHVGEHSYIKELMERLAGKSYEESIPGAEAGQAEAEAEAEKLEVIRELHPEWSKDEVEAEVGAERLEEYLEKQEIDTSITMEEILLVLKLQGSRTVARLARDINVTLKTAKAYVALLEKRGLVRTATSKRGGKIVELPKKRRLRRRNPWSPKSEPDWRGEEHKEIDVPRLFVFNGVSVSTDMLLNELHNMEKDQQAIIIYDGARYRISGYGYEKSNIKIVLENIIKFSPESLIKFILTYEKR